jgi:sulfite oxidase
MFPTGAESSMIERPSDSDSWPNRRDFLQRSLALGAAGLILPASAESREPVPDPAMIVRSRRPLDAETPVEVFESQITPNRLFFVRSHFGTPAVSLTDNWTLAIDGGVKQKSAFTLENLSKFKQVTIPAVLQCSGNGRAFYSPTIPGVGWLKGAVGNAEWTGVRLVELLDRAGIEPGMAHVHLHAADGPPMPKTPAYFRSIPLDRARLESTIIATRMNGVPMPAEHGGPVRLVLPGWSGNHWIKWLRTLVVARNEAPGPYMQASYKMPIKPTPPGVDLKPSELKSLTVMNVKSLIARPLAGAVLKPGRIEVQGVAWTGGEATVTRVEVALGIASGQGGTWTDATLEGPARPYTWRRWRFAFDAGGPASIVVRARTTDSNGEIQPEVSPWNKSGYLWNGYDQVACEVR